MHDGRNPWADVVISGHAQDPHGKKMSKSKGNVIEPQVMIEKYSADALRFWAASSKLGEDLPFAEKELVSGQKFMTKLWNASKFVFMHLEDFNPKAGKPKLTVADRWLLAKVKAVADGATESFEQYEYFRTKADTEKFFWQVFCDQYLEMVKYRLYNPDTFGQDARRSGQYALYHTLLAILKLMAPVMPHITEEIYQGFYRAHEGVKSIHASGWPSFGGELSDADAEAAGDLAAEAITAIRKAKSEANMALNAEIEAAKLTVQKGRKNSAEEVAEDIKGTGKIKTLKIEEGGDAVMISFI
jgi:valyl-tRNA synthetase